MRRGRGQGSPFSCPLPFPFPPRLGGHCVMCHVWHWPPRSAPGSQAGGTGRLLAHSRCFVTMRGPVRGRGPSQRSRWTGRHPGDRHGEGSASASLPPTRKPNPAPRVTGTWLPWWPSARCRDIFSEPGNGRSSSLCPRVRPPPLPSAAPASRSLTQPRWPRIRIRVFCLLFVYILVKKRKDVDILHSVRCPSCGWEQEWTRSS